MNTERCHPEHQRDHKREEGRVVPGAVAERRPYEHHNRDDPEDRARTLTPAPDRRPPDLSVHALSMRGIAAETQGL